jgi:hypothetical protein
VPGLPNQVQINVAAGSQWPQCYQLLSNGAPADISTATFRFVVRPSTSDTAEPALISVNSVESSSQGYITVTVETATIMVVLSPTATALLGQSADPYALWMNPGTPSQTDLVTGTSFCQLVPLP